MTALLPAAGLTPVPCRGGCGQQLTDADSIRVGMGAGCAAKHGIWHPQNATTTRPASTVQGGPSLLDHLNGDRMDDTLFPEPTPADPDEAIAREEIDAFYRELIADAQAAVAVAQQALARAVARRDVWSNTGTPPRDPLRDLDMEVLAIVGRGTEAYRRAAMSAIEKPGDRGLRETAEQARCRDEAVRRWLTARGYGLGALALPAPKTKKR